MRIQNSATPTPKAMPGTATGSIARYSSKWRFGIRVRCVAHEIAMPITVETVAAMSEMIRLFRKVARTSSDVQRYSKFAIVNRPDQVNVEKAAATRTRIGAMIVRKQ